ncbi:MAG: hypothetical protein IKU11_12330, partial [Clostridia bacterium]|nr:hypothetical protein [Clostridia bacterium]
MSAFFLDLLNASISASWIVLAVLLVRWALKKAPKWIAVLLWGLIAVRLICPFSLESVISLIPSAETISPQVLLESPEIDTGFSVINNTVNPIIKEATVQVSPEKGVNTMKMLVIVFSRVWAVGVGGMLLYAAISYACVKRKIGEAVLLRDRIFQSERVISPFVLGIVKPKIYLPYHVKEQDMPHVIAHEMAHIRRNDHLWKPLGFLLLAFHWFNPLMWLGYVLFCRDIELACDEKVVKKMNAGQKADYAQALMTCSVDRRMIAACPLAFGEVGVKNRIQSVLSYKKPAFWVMIAAVVSCILVAACFLTDPLPKTDRVTLRETDGVGTDWTASYQVDLGRKVGSGTLVVESWYKGEIIRYNQVLITGKAKEFSLSMSVRRDEESNEGVDVDIKTDQYGGSLLSYVAFPMGEEISGWSFTSHKVGEKLTVTPGNDLVLAAMAFDTGRGVRVVDVKKLAEDPKYLGNYDCMVLVRATFSDEAMEPQAVGIVPEETSEPKEVLTLDAIRKLAEKGEALSWEDFEIYDYVETGSGLYIRSYETDDPLFTLLIGGTWIDNEPMYIYLEANNGTEARIDIRTGDVDAFVEANRELPIMESLSGSWWWCRVEPKRGGNVNDEILNLVSGDAGVPAGSDPGQGLYLPVIRITNSQELAELAKLVEGEVYSYPDDADSTPLGEKLKEYDDAYFAEKELVVVWPPNGNYTVNSINYTQGTLSVIMEDLWPDRDGTTPVVGEWLIPVEIGKVAGSDEISEIRSVAK